MNFTEKTGYKAVWVIRKFIDEESYLSNKPYGVVVMQPNVLLNEGVNELFTILCSSGGTKFDNANAHLGVGDGFTPADPAQTGLLGANKLYKGMDTGFPTFGTLQKATWRATFGGSEANFAWREFTVANGSDDGAVNLNRLVSDQGVKVSGQVWELSLSITLG